jgi:YfiH family protein
MDAITPDWPVPDNVRAVCTTRDGGVSHAPYDTLNLGDHVGDDAQHVARNRAIAGEWMRARPVYMEQVHGVAVVEIDSHTRDGVRADGCITNDSGIACTIMVADCLPVLLARQDGSRVGAAHAGWRGVSAGVIEATARAMTDDPESLVAWLGPCIGPEAFEVGGEVKAEFVERDAIATQHFRAYREGKWLADLAALARMRLQKLGVTRIHGNDGTRAWCTVSNPSRFFSHRRDRVSGRFAAAVWRA